jgi:hypothetical protein
MHHHFLSLSLHVSFFLPSGLAWVLGASQGGGRYLPCIPRALV